ncbi:DNA-binding response regulator [Synergistales bacterium]|nr:DNA-binding response regulator [Synergistales bacterium]
MKTLLCVEDERDLLQNNRRFFEKSGYTVLSAENLAQAREHLATNSPDAIILDIMLPDGLGLDLLKELREKGHDTPVLLLTAWGRPQNIAAGLRAGANDYLTKPFDYDVLLARVEAMLRGAEQIPEKVAKGSLTLNVIAGQTLLKGADMLLTQKEFAMLLLFSQNEGRTISAEYLYEKVWGQPLPDDSQAVKSTASRLRKKLAESGYTIRAERGEGYIFESE